MKRILLSITTILFLLLTLSSPGSANFADTYGFSPKGISQGNAMCAKVNDWSSPYYNIGGLGKSYGDSSYNNQLGFAYLSNTPDFEIDINRAKSSDGSPLSTDGDKDLDTGTIIFGFTVDIQQIFMELPVVSTAKFGLVGGVNDDLTASKINDLEPRTHNFMIYGRETQSLTIMQGMGFGFLNDSFGFGLGLNSSFGGEGNVQLLGVELQDAEQTPVANSTMDMQIELSIVSGFYFSPGRLYDSMEGLEFGLAYRAESELNIDPFKTVSVTELGDIPLDLALAMQDFYQPPIATFGVAYEFNKFQIAMDLEYQMWSEYAPSSAVIRNFEDELEEFDDIIIPRIGLEMELSSDMSLLAGYYYQPSFVPENAVAGKMNFLDNDKHVGSMGISYTLPDKFMNLKGQMAINAGCQVQYLEDREVYKTSPTPENPDYSYGGVCYSFILGGTLSL